MGKQMEFYSSLIADEAGGAEALLPSPSTTLFVFPYLFLSYASLHLHQPVPPPSTSFVPYPQYVFTFEENT